MKFSCDGCGRIGNRDELASDYDGRQLCAICARAEKIADLKQKHAAKKEWLERTHLQELRELARQIADLERL